MVFSLKLTLVTVVNKPSIISRHVFGVANVSPSAARAKPMSAPVSWSREDIYSALREKFGEKNPEMQVLN